MMVICDVGILRNLAFESVALRKEIIAFGGVEALLKVRCPSHYYLINYRLIDAAVTEL